MVLFMPLNGYLLRKFGAIQRDVLAAKDARTRAMNDMLTGVRLTKYFAWEDAFDERITGKREVELQTALKGKLYQSTLWIGEMRRKSAKVEACERVVVVSLSRRAFSQASPFFRRSCHWRRSRPLACSAISLSPLPLRSRR